MNGSLYQFISFLCAIQGILISLVLLFKKERHPGRILLGTFVFLFSIGMLENYLNEHISGIGGRLIYDLLGLSNFLYGPLLYLFVRALTVKEARFARRHILHFIPFLLLLSIDTISVVFFDLSLRADDPIIEFVLFELLVIQILSYNVAAIHLLAKYRRRILEIHSDLEEHDLNWLKHLMIFLTSIYVISFGITHLVAFGHSAAARLYVIVQFLITVSIYLLSYRMVLRPQLFLFKELSANTVHDIQTTPDLSTDAHEKYQRSGLKPEQAELYAARISQFMERQKPYLSPEITIHELAWKLNISRNHLTEVINERFGRNFFEFINAYRVEEVKKLLIDPSLSHLNLSAIGLQAGFRSKTAFNTNFRKFTGLTPTEWKARAGEMAMEESGADLADGTALV